MKILPIEKNIKHTVNKTVKNNINKTKIKSVKNYSDYLKEYGLK